MYVKLHRYHWFIKGNNFFKFHEEFERMYQVIANDIDVIAERILMIDGKPYATMIKYLKGTTLVEANADDTEDEIITQLIADYKQINSEIYQTGITSANEAKDMPTLDMLVNIQEKLEQYIWMLQAYQTDK